MVHRGQMKQSVRGEGKQSRRASIRPENGGFGCFLTQSNWPLSRDRTIRNGHCPLPARYLREKRPLEGVLRRIDGQTPLGTLYAMTSCMDNSINKTSFSLL